MKKKQKDFGTKKFFQYHPKKKRKLNLQNENKPTFALWIFLPPLTYHNRFGMTSSLAQSRDLWTPLTSCKKLIQWNTFFFLTSIWLWKIWFGENNTDYDNMTTTETYQLFRVVLSNFLHIKKGLQNGLKFLH